MIRIENVGFRRAGLWGVSLAIEAGELLAIAGPNGAGKSTLLSMLAGEIAPDVGDVLWNEIPMRRMTPGERARRIGVLPQSSNLSFPFRVDEVVALGRLPFGGGGAAIVRRAMEEAGVSHLAGRAYPNLSGGEKQRVHFARVLAQVEDGAGRLLLLDEPTSSLDPAQQHAVLHVARRRAAAGAAVVVVLHDLNLAARWADRIALLAGGRLLAQGTPAEVLTPARLDACYGIRALVLEHPERRCPLVVTG